MFISLEEAFKMFKAGHFLILVDDEKRENEGDLVIAAQFAHAKSINFMARYGRGLICVSLPEKRLKELEIVDMVKENENLDPFRTAFTISVDSAHGITTGISAYDRAKTIQVLIDPKTEKTDLVKPGHIFPLKAKRGGILERQGHTEASLALCTLNHMYPGAVICEIMKNNGKMARLKDLKKFSEKHKIPIISIAQILNYVKSNKILIKKITEPNLPKILIRKIAETSLPTNLGLFYLICYEDSINKDHHLVLIHGDISQFKNPLVRIHSSCTTGDIFKSKRCDCGEQLDEALNEIIREGKGICIYMKEEGRGIGISNKIKSYVLQDKGYDTVEANQMLGFKKDLRNHQIAGQILYDLKITQFRLLTNNPEKINAMKNLNLNAIRVPLIIRPNSLNKDYLKTKQKKMGHFLNFSL